MPCGHARPTSDEAPGLDRCVSADTFGHFVLSNVLASADAILASAAGYRSRVSMLDSVRPANAEIVIELELGGEAVAGYVVDATGGPVAGAQVTLRVSSGAIAGATLSASDGAFAITDSPGIIELCVQAEAYSRACSEARVPSEGNVLVITPESRIVGQVVTRATGRPAAGVSVKALNFNGLHIPARSTTTREDGSFVIDDLPAGGYEVVDVSVDSRSSEQRITVGLAQTTTVTLLSDAAVRVSGVVLVSGEPCLRGDVVVGSYLSARAIAG
jgi:hypothetical protein